MIRKYFHLYPFHQRYKKYGKGIQLVNCQVARGQEEGGERGGGGVNDKQKKHNKNRY